MLWMQIKLVKERLEPGKPFGVDFLLPRVGGNARKTNLAELIDILIEDEVPLFICAVGVPPTWAVEKLHAAGIVCMNMVGLPKHADHALDVGMDIICAQGTEAGGHTGEVATFPLIPMVVDKCKGRMNFFGKPVAVVAAGGVFDGRGLAASLCLGASGVWVGTRFIASTEASASEQHKKNAGPR